MWPKPGSSKPVPKISYVKLFKPWGWIIGSGVYLDDVKSAINSVIWQSGKVILVATIFSLLLCIVIAVRISRNTKHIVAAAKAISTGDYTKEIAVKSGDEIGQMAQALQDMLNELIVVIGEGQSFKEGLSFPFFITDKELKITYANTHFAELVGKPRDEIIGQPCASMVQFHQCGTASCLIRRALESGEAIRDTAEMGKGDEKRFFDMAASVLKDLKGNIYGAYEVLLDITEQKKAQEAIEENHKFLLKMAEEVQEVANQVASAAEVLSSQSDEIATGAEEQSAQANQVAAAVEEMNATITEVAKSAQEAADRSQEARNVATRGNTVVEDSIRKIQNLAETTQKVAESVEALAEKSREIDKVIDVISDIADQTNLLALNATIEAASAGEAGKGFAVVAGEVKELAKQTAESTESVGEAIQQIQEGIRQSVEMIEETLKEVSEATALAGEAGNSLGEIVAKAGDTAEMVTGIAAATQQQSAAVNEISKNVDGIMTVSQKTAEGITESAKAARELARLSEKLLETVKQFQRS